MSETTRDIKSSRAIGSTRGFIILTPLNGYGNTKSIITKCNGKKHGKQGDC